MKKNKVKLPKNVHSTNKIYLPLLFILYSIIFEFSNFLYLGFTGSNGSKMVFPSYFLYDLAIIMILAAIIFIVQGRKTMKAFFFIFLTIHFLLNVINTTMYSIYGDVMSWDLVKLGAEATTAITMDFIDWGGVALNFCLFFAMIVGVVLLQKYNKKTIKLKHFSFPVIAFAIFFLSQSINVCLLQVQSSMLTTAVSEEREIETSDKYLWDNFQFKIEAYKKFGHFGFYAKGALTLLFGSTLSEDEKQWYIDYIDEGHVDGDETAPLHNDNLIVLLCESVDLFAIDPINTPTLYNISQGYNSVVFENFHARNRTNISEGITLLGNMPKNRFLANAQQAGYEFDYSLPKVFKDAGDDNVVTTFLHPNTWGFYQRNVTHTPEGLGFDEKYSIEDYKGEQKFEGFGHWITDVSFTKEFMDEMLPTNQRFLTYFSTLSTHGAYTSENPLFEEYYQIFDENYEEFAKWQTENTEFIMPEEESGTFKQYRIFKSHMIDFDRMVENLLKELTLRGLEQNTSILFFADHNAYYHDLTYKIKGVEKDDFSNTYINHIPMYLYSPKFAGEQGMKVESFCNTYDILPTLCDLYGMDSNKNLYQGNSIFSDEIKNSIFASHLGGIFTENIYSNNIAKVYVLDESVTEEDMKNFKTNANKFYRQQEYLELIYQNGINGTKR